MTWVNPVKSHLRCFYSVVIANSKLDFFLHMSQTQASLFAPIWRACEERATLSALRPSHHTLRSLLYCWIVAPMDKGMVFFPA